MRQGAAAGGAQGGAGSAGAGGSAGKRKREDDPDDRAEDVEGDESDDDDDDDDGTDEEDAAEDLPGKAKQQKATLPEGERVCWRQFADTGCTSAGCGFVHVGPLGMGWMPSPMQLSQLRRQVRGLRGQTRWDWGKIDGFEFPRDVFA